VRSTLVALALSFCGCYSVSTATVGPHVAPREPACDVAFSHERPQELAERFEQVGVICFGAENVGWPEVAVAGRRADLDTQAAYRPGGGHEAVRESACHLGGELVAPAGLCGKDPYHVELAVWRKKRND
jgi:hypothetical protein